MLRDRIDAIKRAVTRGGAGASRMPFDRACQVGDDELRQLATMADYESDGRTFESFRARHFSTEGQDKTASGRQTGLSPDGDAV